MYPQDGVRLCVQHVFVEIEGSVVFEEEPHVLESLGKKETFLSVSLTGCRRGHARETRETAAADPAVALDGRPHFLAVLPPLLVLRRAPRVEDGLDHLLYV